MNNKKLFRKISRWKGNGGGGIKGGRTRYMYLVTRLSTRCTLFDTRLSTRCTLFDTLRVAMRLIFKIWMKMTENSSIAFSDPSNSKIAKKNFKKIQNFNLAKFIITVKLHKGSNTTPILKCLWQSVNYGLQFNSIKQRDLRWNKSVKRFQTFGCN